MPPGISFGTVKYKKKNRVAWHKWFAWLPVWAIMQTGMNKYDFKRVWFKNIERKKNVWNNKYEYRVIRK